MSQQPRGEFTVRCVRRSNASPSFPRHIALRHDNRLSEAATYPLTKRDVSAKPDARFERTFPRLTRARFLMRSLRNVRQSTLLINDTSETSTCVRGDLNAISAESPLPSENV